MYSTKAKKYQINNALYVIILIHLRYRGVRTLKNLFKEGLP